VDYFISDIHFGHKKVIRFCQRPFKTVSEMNAAIIENWNSNISDSDRVFVIGDVFVCSHKKAAECVKQLNGHKILVKGNHDSGEKQMLNMGFDEFYRRYDYTMPDGRLALLQHFPCPDILVDSKYDLLIHGHIHIDEKVNGKKINVSADIWNYTPVSVSDLCQLKTETGPEEKIEFNITEDGMLDFSCKIRMEDFSGFADYVYKEMSSRYPNRRKK